MNLEIKSLPWEEYKALYEQGKLRDKEWQQTKESSDFYDKNASYFSDLAGDSHISYHAAYLDSKHFSYVDFACKKSFVTFCTSILNEQFGTDLGVPYEIDGVESIISAERVKILAEEASKIDLIDVQKIFNEISNSDSINDRITDSLLSGDPDAVLLYPLQNRADEFTDYLSLLINFVSTASKENKCLVITTY